MTLVGVLLGAFGRQTWRQWRVVEAGTQGYLIGDWTISYAGGFVRRGFFGWALLTAAPDASSALLLLWTIQTLLYAVIFGIVIWWALRLPSPYAWAPLLLSPAFLLFGLNDFGGTHRKEIFVIAALLMLAESVRSARWVPATTAVATLLFIIGVLSHEANALLVVPFVLLLRSATGAGSLGRRFAQRASLFLVVVAASGLVAAVIYPGTTEQQEAICLDLLQRGFDEGLCRGSLRYIGVSAAGEVLRLIDRLPRYLLFAVPATLATIPFIYATWARENRRMLALAVLPLTPLFLIAVDWGRWIMIATVIATVLTVVEASRRGLAPAHMPAPVLLLFVAGWSVPHVSIRQALPPSDVLDLVITALESGARFLGG